MNRALGDEWMGNETQNTLARIDEAEQVFRNFIVRLIGYHLTNTFVGLVTFDEVVEVDAKLSRVSKEFKDKLENVETGGMTAIWDAVGIARTMLDIVQGAASNHKTSNHRLVRW